MTKECQIDVNKKNCPCPYNDCERHSMCCKCVYYHRKNGDLPMCLRRR
ncbi:MAG: hypothetical protein N2053_08495 [Chitinispirillaceae bacterium]|nr:hypothetical protein [Chitinispirillaceae bacterium]